MPQLDLYGECRRTAIHWSYSIDPLQPTDRPMFYVSVTGHGQLAVEHGLVMPPLNVVHEEVSDLLQVTWDAYLFGEPDDVRKATGSSHKRWLGLAAEWPA